MFLQSENIFFVFSSNVITLSPSSFRIECGSLHNDMYNSTWLSASTAPQTLNDDYSNVHLQILHCFVNEILPIIPIVILELSLMIEP